MSMIVDIRKKLASFTLEVQMEAENETVGFLGESGCGKTMTMRCVAGIEKPDEGKIIVNGQTYFDSAAGINLSPQRRKTALLFQNYMLFPHMTVADNIAAGIDKSVAGSQRDAEVRAQMERFGIAEFAKRYPLQLSGGQQQRVALARMLAARPGILMLDEPFSALDAHLKGVLEQNLANLFDSFDGTILYVSHDIDEALRFCDRIAVVEEGKIVELGPAARLIDNPQSQASLKLSGCKNVTEVRCAGEHEVYAPKWGVSFTFDEVVPEDVKYMGVRAFRIERTDGPGPNVHRVRVDRVSDSRFDRSLMLQFLDRSDVDYPTATYADNEMKYLHQHVIWRIDKLQVPDDELPEAGDELYVRFPVERLHLVCR